jgi:hypothetical protein
MNNNRPYKLGNGVVNSMLLTSFLFLGLMAFKYTIKENCGVVNFSFRTANKNDIVYTNEKVYFSSELKFNAESWEWDFGDKLKAKNRFEPHVEHVYDKPGQYTVRLIINKTCEFARTINVNKREDVDKKLVALPLWPAEPLYVGREYSFDDETVGAVTWSWYFDKQPKYLQKNITRIFTEPGTHTVTLVLNDNWEGSRVERTFNVLPALVKNSARIPMPQQQRDIRMNPSGGSDAQDKPISDKAPGKSLEELAEEAKKIPTITDQVLKGYVLGINGTGYTDLKKYLKNNSYGNCTFLFNDKNLTLDQVKENISVHYKYGESIDIKQSTNNYNHIIQITITAKLKAKNRFVFKDKQREYPY